MLRTDALGKIAVRRRGYDSETVWICSGFTGGKAVRVRMSAGQARFTVMTLSPRVRRSRIGQLELVQALARQAVATPAPTVIVEAKVTSQRARSRPLFLPSTHLVASVLGSSRRHQ